MLKAITITLGEESSIIDRREVLYTLLLDFILNENKKGIRQTLFHLIYDHQPMWF